MATQAYNVDFSYNDNTFTSVKGFWNTIIVTRFENKKKRKKERKRRMQYVRIMRRARARRNVIEFTDDYRFYRR